MGRIEVGRISVDVGCVAIWVAVGDWGVGVDVRAVRFGVAVPPSGCSTGDSIASRISGSIGTKLRSEGSRL